MEITELLIVDKSDMVDMVTEEMLLSGKYGVDLLLKADVLAKITRADMTLFRDERGYMTIIKCRYAMRHTNK